MEQSPVSHFTPEDKQIMRKTARDALDNVKDGTKIGWENPETGHSGSVKPINTIEKDGTTCRKTRFFNSAEGLTAIQIHRLCRQKDGTWKIDK
jgi:surface antigen